MSEQESAEQKSTESNSEYQKHVGDIKHDKDNVDVQSNSEAEGITQNKDENVESNVEENQKDTDRKAKEDKGLLSRLSSRIGVGGEVAKKVGRREE